MDNLTGVKHQAPAPKIAIYKPDNADSPYMSYVAEKKTPDESDRLLSYSFSESVSDLNGSFSFTVENEETGTGGETAYDRIAIRSIVKIYEGDENKPVFVGVIRRKRIGASMTERGVRRNISFSGYSVISILANFTVSMDIKIIAD
jgi:hypothetical protein